MSGGGFASFEEPVVRGAGDLGTSDANTRNAPASCRGNPLASRRKKTKNEHTINFGTRGSDSVATMRVIIDDAMDTRRT